MSVKWKRWVGLDWALEHVLPGWQKQNCGWRSALAWELHGASKALIVEPEKLPAPAVLKAQIRLPQRLSNAVLKAGGAQPWRLTVGVDGTHVVVDTVEPGGDRFWSEIPLPLQPFAAPVIALVHFSHPQLIFLADSVTFSDIESSDVPTRPAEP